MGTPDPPNAAYFILDVVNDFEARVAVAKLANSYDRIEQGVRAEECRQLLADTQGAHRLVCEARNPKGKTSKTKSKLHA